MRVVPDSAAGARCFAALPPPRRITPHQRQARAIYERLISFRTAAGHGQVPAMAAYIAETLRAGGVPAENIVILAARGDGGDARARSARARRHGRARPILFSGHMDVVDARPEDWERARSRLDRGEWLFLRARHRRQQGRHRLDGLDDPAPHRRAADRPRTTLVFAFIGDEETGMATTRLVAAHPWVRSAAYAINTDAGGGTLSQDGRALTYGVQGAEKTFASFHAFDPQSRRAQQPSAARQCDLRIVAGAASDPGDPLSGDDQCDHAGGDARDARRRRRGRRAQMLRALRGQSGGCGGAGGAAAPIPSSCARSARPASRRCSRPAMPRMRCRSARGRRSIAGSFPA